MIYFAMGAHQRGAGRHILNSSRTFCRYRRPRRAACTFAHDRVIPVGATIAILVSTPAAAPCSVLTGWSFLRCYWIFIIL